jgi:hypothetical protein
MADDRADDSELRRDLLWRIETRRASVQAFLREHRPRTRRRATLAVVLSSLAAVFTAGPAFGGEGFAQSVKDMFGVTDESMVWQVLCLLAVLVSVGAAVLANLSKTHDDAGRLSSAEAVNCELEGLAGLLQYGHLTAEDAVKLYQQYSVKVPFIDDQPVGPPAHGSAPATPHPRDRHSSASPPSPSGYPPPPPHR